MLGALHVAWYHDFPNVRNAMLYGRIALDLLDGGLGLAVSAARGVGKSLGFPLLAAPLVAVLGPDVGLKAASWVGTAAWVLALLPFYARLAPRFGVPPDWRAPFCLVVLANPLAVYQFISAYPDTLFAAVVLWAMWFLDRLCSSESRWYDGAAFAVLTLAAVIVKLHGLMLLPIAAVVFLARRSGVAQLARTHRVVVTVAVVSVGLLLAAMLMGGTTRGGFTDFGAGWANYTQGRDRLTIVGRNLVTFLEFVAFMGGALLPFLSWRALLATLARGREWTLALGLFVVAVVVYDGSYGNFRYFLGAAPLVALVLLGGLRGASPRRRTLAVATLLIVNSATVGLYDVVAVHDAVTRVVPVPPEDNFRLTSEQREARDDIRRINALAGDGYGPLVLNSNYYGDRAYAVWERAGLFAPGLRVIYTQAWDRGLVEAHALRRFIVYDARGDVGGDPLIAARGRRLSERVMAVDLAPGSAPRP